MFSRLSQFARLNHTYDNLLTQQRAQSLLTFLLVSIVGSILGMIITTIQILSLLDSGDSFATILTLLPAYTALPVTLILIWLVRNGYYQTSAVGIVSLSVITLISLWDSEFGSGGFLAFALPIILSGLLLEWQYTTVVTVIVALMATGPTLITQNDPVQYLLLITIAALISGLILIIGTNVQRTAGRLITELNKLQTVIESLLSASQVQSEHQAMTETLNTIRDQLGYTFARIYLVEAEEVTQRVQMGLNQRQLNIDTHTRIGQRSGIYAAVNSKKSVFMAENDDPLVRQHLLSGTLSAIAVPVLDTNQDVIAVIDIQSESPIIFTNTEIKTIELAARQLSISLESLRKIQSLRRDLIDQDDLIERQRKRLLQYEQAERQTTTESWRDYLTLQGVDYLGYDKKTVYDEPIEASELTADIKAAIQTGDILVEVVDEQQIVKVPIKLRGQTLGAMTFRVPQGTQVVGARQQELIRNVVQRLSLALENKRLFEQSQSQAQRESKANQVGNLLLSSTDINTVLQLAAENFNDALGAVQTQIRLIPDAQTLGESEGQS